MVSANEYVIKMQKSTNLGKDYYGFDFAKPEGFTFSEGQFALFGLVGKEITGRKLRAFSLASTGEEPFIRVATKIVAAPSDFKAKLLEMKPGEELTMQGPLGMFTFSPEHQAVFIAGGIGITPIRSMLMCQARMSVARQDILIYSELESNYPFRAELEKLPGLEIHYAADVEPTQKIIVEIANKHKDKAFFYLSGSPGFVNGIQSLLEKQGVTDDCIRHDVFIGY